MKITNLGKAEVEVIPNGDLTGEGAREFREAVGKLFVNGSRRFMLDFQNVSDISAEALATLLILDKKLEPEADSFIRVSNLGEDMLRMFKALGLETHCELEDAEISDEDEEEAVS